MIKNHQYVSVYTLHLSVYLSTHVFGLYLTCCLAIMHISATFTVTVFLLPLLLWNGGS